MLPAKMNMIKYLNYKEAEYEEENPSNTVSFASE